MMCQRMGRPPISIIGFGLTPVSSLIRVPSPPANITAFIKEWEMSQKKKWVTPGLLRSHDSPQLLDSPGVGSEREPIEPVLFREAYRRLKLATMKSVI